jgi:hypothetical protein
MEARRNHTKLNVRQLLSKDTIYNAVVLGVPPIAITLPLYLVINNGLSPDRAAAIPLAGALIIATTTALLQAGE